MYNKVHIIPGAGHTLLIDTVSESSTVVLTLGWVLAKNASSNNRETLEGLPTRT